MCPRAPTSLPLTINRKSAGTFKVRPTEEPSWSDDAGTYVCRYVTDDTRIHPEFRTWMAVWIDGRWEVDEI